MSSDPYAPPKDDSLPSPQAPTSSAQVSPDQADEIARRLKSLNTRSLAIGGLGLALQGAGSLPGQLGAMLRVAGAIFLVIGLSDYARMRGQSPWLGLLGLASCLGILVLLLLPKRCFNCRTRLNGPWCASCGAPSPP